MVDKAIPQQLGDRIGDISSRVRVLEKPGPWLLPTFNGLWTNYASGFEGLSVRMLGDIVFVRGLVRRSSGSPAANESVFTLPVGWRPPYSLVFMCNESVGWSRFDVVPNGNVNWVLGNAAGAAGYSSLSSIFFSITPPSTLTLA